MLANSREELVEVFDALDAELDRLDEVSFEVLTTPERLRSLNRPGMSGDSSSWKGWGHVRWFIEEVPAGAA
ncbi:REP13E12 repeat protein [Mycobacterium tuberculosis]|uniref:hypothetical protein n=1 Tax=Mycobacterium tuberculosis TaxID=1773 RepID=UPI0005E61A8A|nr:hypothetical protein [Mycobacterium tuberculosis]CNE69154.1 REP13E12 repeat protein [Mycobacterium tuberculosis]